MEEIMASYIDGFVLVVPKKKLPAYRRLAAKAGKIWKEYGALDYVEAAGDHMNVRWGKPFPKLAKTKTGETVIFSYIVYKSRKHRDEVNKAVMKDKRMKTMCDPKDMPFDMKRMSYGGFKTIVEL
jgi:uncharacterized protein YbaA (DUF1428 family)